MDLPEQLSGAPVPGTDRQAGSTEEHARCLPTGLGKTLIAAVLMYNYHRWFPDGQIIFMAPTKPFVAQQVEACHDAVGLPEEDTAQLDGNVPVERRRELWRKRRVFYCTPQTVANDLAKGVFDASRVVLLVVD